MAVGSSDTLDQAQALNLAPVPYADWLVVAPVALPIALGALLLMWRKETNRQAAIAIFGLALVFLGNAALLWKVLEEGPVVMTMGRWLPPFGITFVADALGASFAAAASFVGLACAIQSARDIGETGRRYGFYPFMVLMIAGVNGSFLTGDIFNLYVWFEVFVISSFGLIVLGSSPRQLDGALKYAVLNLVATTMFLITTGLLYGTFGTLNMADIALRIDGIRDTGPILTLATLFLAAFGMKAAAFPLNTWLPASYHTPRVVVSALFGGLLTKVGIYALLRVLGMIFTDERLILSDVIAWVAALTMILGIAGALVQSDPRRILGFVVVSGIGVMLTGLALGTQAGLAGTIAYAIQSMMVMSALYIVAGLMSEASGHRTLHRIGGLYRSAPFLTAITLLLILAAAGLPPGSGVWPKVMLVRASIEAGNGWLAFAILASGLLTTIALGRMFAFAFWRPAPEIDGTAAVPKPLAPGAYLAVAMLALPIFCLGVAPEILIQIADRAAEAILEPASYAAGVFPAGADAPVPPLDGVSGEGGGE